MSGRSTATSIDEYIAEFPPEVQKVLQEVRAVIKAAAPEATETISYAIPTFDLKKRHLIHFAGYKSHIGLYPTPSGTERFEEELKSYKQGRGSVQFPLSQPVPFDLIRRIVEFRLQEVTAKSAKKPATTGDDLPSGLAAPARRALANAGYSSLEQLARVRASDLLHLHGMGPKAMGQLRDALAARGLSFAGE